MSFKYLLLLADVSNKKIQNTYIISYVCTDKNKLKFFSYWYILCVYIVIITASMGHTGNTAFRCIIIIMYTIMILIICLYVLSKNKKKSPSLIPHRLCVYNWSSRKLTKTFLFVTLSNRIITYVPLRFCFCICSRLLNTLYLRGVYTIHAWRNVRNEIIAKL